MPEILDRCVRHVMDKGHSEGSAFAICRASLGLLSDGTEDHHPMEIPEEEMRSRVEIALRFQGADPPLIKEFCVCGPMGKFVNGDQRGVMDRKRLAKLAERFKTHPRQVPVFMLGDHPDDNDQQLPVGWVEGLRMEGDRLMARVKLLGPAAAAVGGDLIRGASIGTGRGLEYDGTPIGEVLKHVLLTNEPFYKELNIAASHQGGEADVCYFTALRPEAEMDKDQEIAQLKEKVAALEARTPDESLTAKNAELESLLAEKTRQNLELTAANANLTEDVKNFRSPKAMEELKLQLKSQDRQLQAEKVRRLVKSGVDAGQFDRALVGDPGSGYDHPSDEAVLTWFRASCFKDSMDRLTIMLETMPRKSLRRQFAGAGVGDDVPTTLTEEGKEYIRRLGHNPDEVIAANKAKDATEYAKLKKAATS